MHFVTSADRAGHLAICVGKDYPFFSDSFNSSSCILHLHITFLVSGGPKWLSQHSWFVNCPQFGIMSTDITPSRNNIMCSLSFFIHFHSSFCLDSVLCTLISTLLHFLMILLFFVLPFFKPVHTFTLICHYVPKYYQ